MNYFSLRSTLILLCAMTINIALIARKRSTNQAPQFVLKEPKKAPRSSRKMQLRQAREEREGALEHLSFDLQKLLLINPLDKTPTENREDATRLFNVSVMLRNAGLDVNMPYIQKQIEELNAARESVYGKALEATAQARHWEEVYHQKVDELTQQNIIIYEQNQTIRQIQNQLSDAQKMNQELLAKIETMQTELAQKHAEISEPTQPDKPSEITPETPTLVTEEPEVGQEAPTPEEKPEIESTAPTPDITEPTEPTEPVTPESETPTELEFSFPEPTTPEITPETPTPEPTQTPETPTQTAPEPESTLPESTLPESTLPESTLPESTELTQPEPTTPEVTQETPTPEPAQESPAHDEVSSETSQPAVQGA